MKNLKITFSLKSNLIIDRLSSIDSILLFQHYNLQKEKGLIPKDTFIETEDDLENLSKWIEIKNGSISGSIWFVEKDEFVMLENNHLIKTIDRNKMLEFTGKAMTLKDEASGGLKKYTFGLEAYNLKSVYFYVRGDKDYIETLCKRVKFLGKKASVGFGHISGYSIEEIQEDKSFMIDETTPAKPLPYGKNKVNSLKVTYYRALPPYHEKTGRVACYMPTTALIETKDNSATNKNFKLATGYLKEYISNPSFLHKKFKHNTNWTLEKEPDSIHYVKINNASEQVGGLFAQETGDKQEELYCACCGSKTARGIRGNIKEFFSANFNDFAFIGKGNVLCEDCMWSVKDDSSKVIGYSMVNDIDEPLYIMGGNMQVFSEKKAENTKLQSKFREEFFTNMDMLKVPYSLNIKTTTNTQHVAIKGSLTLSNAYACVNFGDNGQELVDVEMLNQAFVDVARILKENKHIKKTHLANDKEEKVTINLSKDGDTLANREIISEFLKKYDNSVRKIINMVAM